MDSGRPPGRDPNRARHARRGPAPDQDPRERPGRTAGQGSPGPVPNEEGLRALGAEIDRSHRPRGRRRGAPRSRRRRRVVWVLGILGAVLVVLVASLAGYAWWLNHEIHRVNVAGLSGSPERGAAAGTENILLVGSTSRCALKVQNPAFGLCSQGVNGVNSDVIMVLHLNPAKRTVAILSIPRDLFVPNARKEGANKVDAALAEGPTQLVAAVEEDFAIPIQHYVELNFDTFAGVVDALGGIDMYFPEPVFDAYSGLNVQTTGCLHLNGFQALQVVRARHLQYKGPGVTATNPRYWPQEAQSDLARIRRDHEFLRVLATAVAKRGLGNPLTDQRLVSSVVGQLTVDNGFSATHMVSLVLTFHGVSVGTAPEYTLPVAVGQFGSYRYKGGYYGDIEFPAQPQDQQVIRQFLGVGANTDTMQGGTLPSPGDVTVSVLNGTGVYDQATTTGAALQALGFKVSGLGDTAPVGVQSETVVYYSSRTPAEVAAAQRVAASMSGAVTLAYDPTMVQAGSQVTVVTGSDFSVDQPAPTSAGAAGQGGGTSGSAPASTTTTTQASSQFSSPTPSTASLAPWDPRSCGPRGTPGP